MTARPLIRTCRRTGAFLFLILSNLAGAGDGRAEAWEGYGRSVPKARYEQDEGANFQYRFGVREAFTPYQDPDLSEAEGLSDPLLDPAFSSYQLIVIINKSRDKFWGRAQTLRVYKRGKGLIYYWLISTGAAGFATPSGYFIPQGFSFRHWSGPYDAPMLWAVFFNGGISLHSSLDRAALYDMGRAADSHGCVHVEDHRAEELFHLIGRSGYGPIDQIDRASGRPLLSGKARKKISGYRTLIIVAPTARFKPVTVPTEPVEPAEPAAPIDAGVPPPEPSKRQEAPDVQESPGKYLDIF